MHILSIFKPHHFFFIFLVISGCSISTTSRNWNITWDPDELGKKEQLLESIRQQQNKAKRPNILLILADDLGKYDISTYGPGTIQTPNLDQLAKEGILFQNAYVTAPICSPSRAAMLTGKHQQRFGFETQPMEFYPSNFIEYYSGKHAGFLGDWKVVTEPDYPAEWETGKQGIPLTEPNLAEIMQAAGYHTGIIGKWHLGYGRSQIPNNRGFNYQYGFYGAFSIYTPTQKTNGYPCYIQDDFSSRYQWNMKRKSTAAIRENNKIIKEKEYLTFAIRDKTIRFLESNKDTNFFLYVAFNAPHVPFQAPQEYYDRFPDIADQNKRVYLAMISALDDAIGEILKKIRDLNLEENTLIYFLSDNGGASYTGATDNGPLKGGKLTYFEGGIRVPFILKWKDHLPAGETFLPAVSAMDIFNTTITQTGIALPESYQTDGTDLIAYITDSCPIDHRHEKLYWRADHIYAIRAGEWKLILSTRDHWLHLYNLSTDQSEKIDLRNEKPELIEELRNYFEGWDRELPSKPLWPGIMERKFIIDGKEYYFPA